MRFAWLRMIVAAALAAGGPALAQSGTATPPPAPRALAPGTTLPPPPDLLPYAAMGLEARKRCDQDLRAASEPAFHNTITGMREAGETIERPLLGLHITLNSFRPTRPFQQMAIIDRTAMVRARLHCARDPRVALIAPERLRADLATLAEATGLRASLCAPMEAATAHLARTTIAALRAKPQLEPRVIADRMLIADAVREMAGDLGAFCPATAHAELTKAADSIEAALRPLAGAILDGPVFAQLHGPFRAAADKLAEAQVQGKLEGEWLRVRCGDLVLTRQTLGSYAGFALPSFIAERANARDRAAFALWEACWDTPQAVMEATRRYAAAG